jgi:competence protein ComFC
LLGVCKYCIPQESFFQDPSGYCSVCKTILQNEICSYCSSRNIFFEKLEFIRWRDEKEKKILRNIKFHSAPHLSNYFRIGFRKILRELETDVSGIVLVPSNQKTKRERPIHPTEPIVRFLESKFQKKRLLCLQKNSKELQSSKSYRDRFLHARFAFSIKKEFQNSLQGKYLLVDDIFTTGASLNECSRILLENGASSVQVLVLARGKS